MFTSPPMRPLLDLQLRQIHLETCVFMPEDYLSFIYDGID